MKHILKVKVFSLILSVNTKITKEKFKIVHLMLSMNNLQMLFTILVLSILLEVQKSLSTLPLESFSLCLILTIK